MSIALYMDTHVHAAITEQLRRRGVNVFTAQEDDCDDLDDEELLSRSTSLGRVMFTFDIRFKARAKDWQRQGKPFAGLIWGHPMRLTIGGVFSAAVAGVKTNLLLFDKGRPTERIWYYDLSDVNVGKRQPFTLDKFDDFFGLLPYRGDSDRSWTVDFVERKSRAAREAEPFKRQAAAKQQEANRWREELARLKKAKPKDPAAIAEADERNAAAVKESREQSARAQAIEEAVYDLKAVNPNKQATRDDRTPAELLDLIEQKGREVTEALAVLRRL